MPDHPARATHQETHMTDRTQDWRFALADAREEALGLQRHVSPAGVARDEKENPVSDRTLSDVLNAGLRWLFDTVQPGDAHQQHHGIALSLPSENRIYGFCPSEAAQDGRSVVTVTVGTPEWIDHGAGPLTLTNPLGSDELSALAAELEARGLKVRRTWNGQSLTGSVGLDRGPHPTLAAAVDRYRRGCTTHPGRSVFCDCDAWRTGFDRIVQPTLAAADGGRR